MTAAEFPNMTWTSFDRYARYGAIARSLRATLGAGQLRVLDVGDSAGYLHAFDADLEVISADIEVPRESLEGSIRIQGDGAALPFADGAFDAVVSCDALEHVPRIVRAAFVDELARVSRRVVILAAPFDTAGVAGAEQLARIYARLSSGAPQVQLEEHVEHGLPVLAETVQRLEKHGLRVVTAGNGNLHDWVVAMLLKFQLETRPFLLPAADALDRVYNHLLAARSEQPPYYRHIVVGDRSGAPDLGRAEPEVPEASADAVALLGAIGVAYSTEVVRHDVREALKESVNADIAGTYQEVIRLHHRVSALHEHVDRAAAMLHGDAVGISDATSMVYGDTQGLAEHLGLLRQEVRTVHEAVAIQDRELRLVHERLDRLCSIVDQATDAARHPVRKLMSRLQRRQ